MAAKIETTFEKTTTKTLSFTALKKMIASKECVDVLVPLQTKTGTVNISVPKKTLINDLFTKFETTEAMFAEVAFIRNDIPEGNGVPADAFTLTIEKAE